MPWELSDGIIGNGEPEFTGKAVAPLPTAGVGELVDSIAVYPVVELLGVAVGISVGTVVLELADGRTVLAAAWLCGLVVDPSSMTVVGGL